MSQLHKHQSSSIDCGTSSRLMSCRQRTFGLKHLHFDQMWETVDGRRSALLDVQRADVDLRRAQIAVAEVLLDRHQLDTCVVEPPGIGAAQVVGGGRDGATVHNDGVALEDVLHGTRRQA